MAGARSLAVDVRDDAAVRAAVDGAEAVLWWVRLTGRSGGDIGHMSMLLLGNVRQGAGCAGWCSGVGVTPPGDDRKPREQALGPTARPVAKADVALAMRELASTLLWVRRTLFLTAG